MIRAVLDANVFVSAILNPKGIPARLIKSWHAEAFILVTSEPILREIDRVLRYPRIVKRHDWPEERIREFLEDLAVFSIVTPGTLTLRVIQHDESDNRYLECAVEGSADVIVSGDQDLLALEEYEGIQILPPKGFLKGLRGAWRER